MVSNQFQCGPSIQFLLAFLTDLDEGARATLQLIGTYKVVTVQIGTKLCERHTLKTRTRENATAPENPI